jgi:hypothetical protein
MAFASQIVVRGDAGFDELDALSTQTGGIVYQKSADTLWRIYDNGEKFISVDYTEKEPRDPDGYWGKYTYLRGTLQTEDEDPADFDWGQF